MTLFRVYLFLSNFELKMNLGCIIFEFMRAIYAAIINSKPLAISKLSPSYEMLLSVIFGHFLVPVHRSKASKPGRFDVTFVKLMDLDAPQSPSPQPRQSISASPSSGRPSTSAHYPRFLLSLPLISSTLNLLFLTLPCTTQF